MTGSSCRAAADRRWLANPWVVAWCVVLALVILAPALGRGFVLTFDMVAVPDLRLVPTSWGGGSALPRAVPQDAVIAVVDTVVPGELLQKLILLGVLVGAGVGVAVMLGRAGLGAGPQAVGATVFVWNPFVAERLVLGHWALLICYACLPWLIDAAGRLRGGQGRTAAATIVLLVALSSLSPTGGVIATAVVVVMMFLPGGRHRRAARLLVVGGALVLQAPWVVPGLVSSTAATSDPAGVEAFAARADSPLGVVGSVLTLGGIWNGDAVPVSRSLVSATIVSLAILALAAMGLNRLPARIGGAATVTVASLGAAGLTVALAGVYAPAIVEWVVAEVPGGGLVRDGQKFLAVYAVLVAVAAGLGAQRLAETKWNAALPSGLIAAVATALPIGAMPDFAWGVAGRVEATPYPPQWAQVRAALEHEPPGDVVVLPYQPFRSFPWTDGRVVLDPAPRYLGREAVVPGDLQVGDLTVRGEDERAADVGTALAHGDIVGLADLGVGYVAVERDTPGAVSEELLAALRPVLTTGVLDLYEVPGPVEPWPLSVPVGVALVANGVALAVVFVAVGARVLPRRRPMVGPRATGSRHDPI